MGLLQKTREVTASTTYEMASKLLGTSPAWEAVDDQTRRQCFDIFVDQLKIQSESRRDDDRQSERSVDGDQRRTKNRKVEKEKPKKKRPREIEEEEEPPKKGKKHAKQKDRDSQDDFDGYDEVPEKS